MEKYPTTHRAITSWAEEDRPREKLLAKGRRSLSDAELIAILIGSGTPKQSAVDLAKDILHSVENNINALAKLSIKDLMKFKGIGEAKAISIIAALELGGRRAVEEVMQKPAITGSHDVYSIMKPLLADLPYEEFWVLYLNKANKVIAKEQISRGGIAGTVADARIIFKKGLELLTSGIILVHNHPSGNLKASKADLQLTRKIKEGAQLLDMLVLDHVIVTDSGYLSFADEGML